MEEIFYSQIIAYYFSCKELCQDSSANIICTSIYFNISIISFCRLLQWIVTSLDFISGSSNVAALSRWRTLKALLCNWFILLFAVLPQNSLFFIKDRPFFILRDRPSLNS